MHKKDVKILAVVLALVLSSVALSLAVLSAVDSYGNKFCDDRTSPSVWISERLNAGRIEYEINGQWLPQAGTAWYGTPSAYADWVAAGRPPGGGGYYLPYVLSGGKWLCISAVRRVSSATPPPSSTAPKCDMYIYDIQYKSDTGEYYVDSAWKRPEGSAADADGNLLPYFNYATTKRCVKSSKAPSAVPPTPGTGCSINIQGTVGTISNVEGKTVEFKQDSRSRYVLIKPDQVRIELDPASSATVHQDSQNIFGKGSTANICITFTGGSTPQGNRTPGTVTPGTITPGTTTPRTVPSCDSSVPMKGGCRLDVLFATGAPTADTQDPPSKGAIENFADKMKSKGYTSLYVYGFASFEPHKGFTAVQSTQMNMDLSNRRAKVVANVITAKGVTPTTAGFGEVATFGSSFASNRRTVISTEPLSAPCDFANNAPSAGSAVETCKDFEKPKDMVGQVFEFEGKWYKNIGGFCYRCSSPRCELETPSDNKDIPAEVIKELKCQPGSGGGAEVTDEKAKTAHTDATKKITECASLKIQGRLKEAALCYEAVAVILKPFSTSK
jgi:hypothetical protein